MGLAPRLARPLAHARTRLPACLPTCLPACLPAHTHPTGEDIVGNDGHGEQILGGPACVGGQGLGTPSANNYRTKVGESPTPTSLRKTLRDLPVAVHVCASDDGHVSNLLAQGKMHMRVSSEPHTSFTASRAGYCSVVTDTLLQAFGVNLCLHLSLLDEQYLAVSSQTESTIHQLFHFAQRCYHTVDGVWETKA